VANKKRSKRSRRDFKVRLKTLSPSKTKLNHQSELNFQTRHFTISKLGEDLASNQDSFEASSSAKAVALSDGASRSYSPKKWSKALVSVLIDSEGEIRLGDIARVIEHAGLNLKEELPWNLEEIRLRGSQATFIRVSMAAENRDSYRVNCLSIGDSLLVIQKNSKSSRVKLQTWPFESVDDFPNAPAVISSIEPYLRDNAQKSMSFVVNCGDSIYLMTDALARYLCSKSSAKKNIQDIFPFLNENLKTNFETWAEDSRRSGLVEDDDLTLIEITLG